MSKQKIAASDVAAAFGGTIAFGQGAAEKVASEIGNVSSTRNRDGETLTGLDALGHLHPDAAGRELAAAVERGTKGEHDSAGARVSIDTCIAALSYLAARAAQAGQQVGAGSDAQPAGRTAVSGTASQAGATSTGPGAAAGGNFGERMAAARKAKAKSGSGK